ncbi:MAG: nitronate monooxygenase [Prolixibacteraceae bacterium]|jgi:NAD(P)H-dependent flavin oxidoreductase YrpB (nitropropane dioxygenase family)|nr:nitronate monooxygenase [Prolixibacteraceae bacterium]
MTKQSIPTLNIGDLKICPPIIQGGMGVRVSGANLASAVANEGCAGVIASVGLGDFENVSATRFVEVNNVGLRDVVRKARAQSNGVIGVNVMVVLSNYEELVKICVAESVDLIICGSGLPLDLPKLTAGSNIKLIPIVSSARAFNIIYKKWKQNYNKIPDAVILEGPMAGGHLGFSYADILNNTAKSLEELVKELVEFVETLEEKIPVIAAGGIWDGADIAKFLKLGASGVQMATRFVCTDECDVDDDFKQAYITAKKEDIAIINSPVGLPGRVIRNEFTKRVSKGETIPFRCPHHCLRSCDPRTAPYCIARVLGEASRGEMDNAFAFAGANAYRCTEIVPVKSLVNLLKEELVQNL